jgi:hypothetical protein
MTPREGFKYGFLLRCAEEGLTAAEAEARAARGLAKRADFNPFEHAFKGGLNAIGNAITGVPAAAGQLAGSVLSSGAAAGGIAAALGGAGIGAGLAKLQEGDVDPEEIQREELIATYRAQAELARRRAIMDAALAVAPRPRSFHGI